MPRGTKKNSLKQSAENNGSGQLSLHLTNKAEERLDIPTMETWLWDAACKIRGATDAPKFKDFILPLIFYKRLDVSEKFVHRGITDIVADLAAAKQEREWADKDLAEVLAKLNFTEN